MAGTDGIKSFGLPNSAVSTAKINVVKPFQIVTIWLRSYTTPTTIAGVIAPATTVNSTLGTTFFSTTSNNIINIKQGNSQYINDLNITTAADLYTYILNKFYPIGSIYISTATTNPGTLFGGTWVQYAKGSVLVGSGGSTSEVISSTSVGTIPTSVPIAGYGCVCTGQSNCDFPSTAGTLVAANGSQEDSENFEALGVASTSPTISSILQPYTVVSIWNRTA